MKKNSDKLKIDFFRCFDCTTCKRVCPVGLAPFRDKKLGELQDNSCIKCKACVFRCPSGALRFSDDDIIEKRKIFNFVVSKVLFLTDDVVEISFEKSFRISGDYFAGAFLVVRIEKKNKVAFRAYSVMMKKHKLQICVKKVKNGFVSNYLFNVKKKDCLHAIFPMGFFGFSEISKSYDFGHDLVFIATGTGIVPILSLLEAIPPEFNKTVRVFFGVRHEKDLFYVDRIKKVVADFSGEVFITLSQPDNNWDGKRGRVTKWIIKSNFLTQSKFFICGNGVMIKQVKNILFEKGFGNKDIFYEDFNE